MLEHASKLHTGPGWAAFADPDRWFQYALVLVLATISGALLAYHPVHRGRPASLEELEQRKTLTLYGVVGALIGVVCTTNPSMAFVIFGIGGLMRFRTDLGASKSTGHTIMATLIGLCWGLGLQMVAVFATIYFWVMIYLLELSSVAQLTVGGVAIADMGRATDAYRKAIVEAGAQLTAHSKNFKKGEMSFVIRLPRGVQRDQVARRVEGIEAALRGTPDWPD